MWAYSPTPASGRNVKKAGISSLVLIILFFGKIKDTILVSLVRWRYTKITDINKKRYVLCTKIQRYKDMYYVVSLALYIYTTE